MPKPTAHGEIWWANVDKRRRVVVVSRNDVRGQRHQATVAIITTTIRGIPSEVALDHRDGFTETCVVNCDALNTVDKTVLLRPFGRLSKQRMESLHAALAFALQLRPTL